MMEQTNKTTQLTARMVANDTAVLEIMEEIGTFGYRLQDFTAALAEAKGAQNIVLRINSPGGDVVEAFAIADLLKNCGKQVRCEVFGVCASAATLIALACSEIAMAANARWMVHEPFFGVRGKLQELQATLSALEKLRADIFELYSKATGKTVQQLEADLAVDCWYSAPEAKAYGWPVTVMATEEEEETPEPAPAEDEDETPEPAPAEPDTDEPEAAPVKATAAARVLSLLGLRTAAQKQADALDYWRHRAVKAEAAALAITAKANYAGRKAMEQIAAAEANIESRINAAVAAQMAAMAADGDSLPAPSFGLPQRQQMAMAELARAHGADAAIEAVAGMFENLR